MLNSELKSTSGCGNRSDFSNSLGPKNRIGGTVGGALLWFVWLRRGRIASTTLESRKYDRMNSPTSRIAAGARKTWLTVAPGTVLLLHC